MTAKTVLSPRMAAPKQPTLFIRRSFSYYPAETSLSDLFLFSKRHKRKARTTTKAPKPKPRLRGSGKIANESSADQKSKETPPFPWRHSPHRLVRLMPNANGNRGIFGPGIPPLGIEGQVVRESARRLPAEITGSWYRRDLFPSQWQQELADSGSFAFQQAVTAVFQKAGYSAHQTNNGCTIDVTSGGENYGKSDEVDLYEMVDSRLVDLYGDSFGALCDQSLVVHLICRPRKAEFISLLWIPYLTREAAGKDESLRSITHNLTTRLWESLKQKDLEKWKGVIESEFVRLFERRSIRHESHFSCDSTMVLQVLIHCEEQFSVIHESSGEVICGHPTAWQNVPHLVRMEAVQDHVYPHHGGKEEATMRPWKITDWDDLLDGNREWFLPSNAFPGHI